MNIIKRAQVCMLWGLVIVLSISIPFSLSMNLLEVGKSTITVKNASCYLDGHDLVFSIDLESTYAETGVDFTLESNDENISITESPNLTWKLKNLKRDLNKNTNTSLEFRLFINGTTDIPSIFSLTVQSADISEKIEIKPFTQIEISESETQIAGEGAGASDIQIADYEILTNPVYKG